MNGVKKVEEYYNDLYLKTEHIELLESPSLRKSVLQNINSKDEKINNILTTFTGMNNLQTLALLKNRKFILEFIRMCNLPQNQKEFLLNFEDGLNLFLPMGSGWKCSKKNRDDSEKIKIMMPEGLNAVITMGLMLSVLVQTQANRIERKRLEISQHDLLFNRELKEEEFELERESLELLKKQLESDMNVYMNNNNFD